MTDVREELRELTAQFRTRLAWSARWGALGVPAGTSPRLGHTSTAETDDLTTLDEQTSGAEELSQPSVVGGEGACVGQAPQAGAVGLQIVRDDLGDCTRCGLSSSRKNIVFGVGNPNAELVFVGEAPGADEDAQGEPFVGAAGQLLTKMIDAMGFSRESVYICNVVKCRPPGNRNPEPDEVASCEPFLKMQLQVLRPRVIVALGKFAAHCLLQTDTPITRLRGNWGTYEGVATMPTLHPAYLLRNPDAKRDVWQDLKAVLAALKQMGIEPPNQTKG